MNLKNLEFKQVANQFRRWQNSERMVRITDDAKSSGQLFHIAGVDGNSILTTTGPAGFLSVIRDLSKANFIYSVVPEAESTEPRFICEIHALWPSGRSCRFSEVLDKPAT